MIRYLAPLLLSYGLTAYAKPACTGNSVPKDHLAYPAEKIYQNVICDPRPTNPELIKTLEGLLIHQSFKLPVEKDGATYKLHVGTAGSFALWRDLLNLNLGRAYYEEGEIKKAQHYWEGIHSGSLYYPMAALESNYAYFKNKEFTKPKLILSQLLKMNLPTEIKSEALLQEALIHLRTGQFQEAAKIASELKFSSLELEELRLKVLAESHFSRYLTMHTSMPFKEKISILKIITDSVEAITPKHRDGHLVYLAAEAYWHTAVAYRIEDPDKHQEIWHKQLEVADDWISPLVDKSLQDQKANLSEEAFFFSIALLWEREFHKKALGRLKTLDKLYPQGVYREDAYQLLGDYYFDEHDFNSAIPYYRQLAQTGTESKAAYGVYKAAWSFYNAKDKYKALRHFERLFQFYLDKKGAYGDEKNELMKESRQDLLLVISEVLNSPKGIEELKSFKLTADETKNMIHDLAKLYQRNGNYKDSTLTWNYLLQHHLADAQATHWIIELALDNFADGKREAISKEIKHHYLPWKNKHFTAEGDKYFATEWSKIILSLHRDAKKSEDPLFWKAADLAYQTYEELRPNGQEGEVWYFGAQKFQFQGKLWDSVEWFKRAGDVVGYAQADDAALSALGLLNDKSGDLSIIENKVPYKADYEKLVSYSKWFFNRPSEVLKKQKELAYFIHSEALFFTGDYQAARDFLVGLFNGKSDEAWQVYLSHNKRLYKNKIWSESHHLALALQKTKLASEQEKFIFLANIAQENAFQLAMIAENQKPSQVSELRKWYEIAYTLPSADSDMKIKSWHNYLLSFTPAESELFEQKLKTFVTEWNGKASSEAPIHELQFNIYAKALKLFDAAHLPFKKGPYLALASEHTANAELAQSLKWDALVLHSQYHQWNDFSQMLKMLQETKADILKEVKYQTSLAKLLFLKGDFQESWNLLQPMIDKKEAEASHWLLVYDLYQQGKLKNDIASYLLEHEKKYKDIVWIRPLWAQIKEASYLAASDLSQVEVDRQPSSTSADDSEAVKAFKERLASVNHLYKVMNSKKEKLKASVIPWIPAISADALCRATSVTHEAWNSLQDLKKNPVISEQWPQFLAKLEEKDLELVNLEKKEQDTCLKVKEETFFVGGFTAIASPFCKELGCLRKKEISSENLIKLSMGLNQQMVSEQFFSYLESGAWSLAETLAAEEKNKFQQTYFYALLRMAADDHWNAFVLLDDLEKNKEWKEKALYLKALMAKRQNNNLLAQKILPSDKVKLTTGEEKLFAYHN